MADGVLVFFGIIAACLVAGVALVVLGRRRARTFPACGACGYDMTGLIDTVDRCPECGGVTARVGILPARPARLSGPMATIGVMLILLSVACLGTCLISIVGAALSG